MIREEAKRLIQQTFEEPFRESQFNLFIKNLLNEIDENKAFEYHGNLIWDAYRDYINQYKRIGQYTDPEGEILDVLVVKLKKETSLERARTMQRNFVGQYFKIRGDNKDNALVAFYHEGLEDWRFSYVKRDYRLEETDSGKVKAREELSPARRLSFLVGRNEPSHTAQQQLVPILEDDKHNPTLLEIEHAFNIETITKEFFEKYRQLYVRLKEELDQLVENDQKINDEFTSKNISTENFAKKLLGQIVFLYFLQKKGWMGVEKDKRGIYKSWGTGPRNFLRKLFNKGYVSYGNFFDEVLEPLFYQALRIDRGEVSEFSQFNCKIPFLNGGLFEPIGDYSWEETRVFIKNETIGEILDTFDLYNFTVKEDEPLDKEVAVDPEMLGKVFENLLEVKDRKSKGTYYTPREIVHYMCQESLINYLDTALNTQKVELVESHPTQQKLIGKSDPEQSSLRANTYKPIVLKEHIVSFIRKGETAIEHDLRIENEGRETRDYSYRIDESIRNNAKLIDEALASIKICDPAVGSGAFPVGMMQEIIKARGILTTYINGSFSRGPYDFKRHCIQESLYGVDIDPSAVDIAKLRLWLSLVVDEDDFGTIKPLPNLDYKIVCGDSLFGIEIDLLNQKTFNQLEDLKNQYFDETNIRKKSSLKKMIDHLLDQITNNAENFDFKVYFSEVFHVRSGFDVVIANPPYVSHDKIIQKNKIKDRFESYDPFADLFCYFIERALEIQNPMGLICFITSNSYLKSEYGRPLRTLISRRNYIIEIISIQDFQVFDSVIVNSCILMSQNKLMLAKPSCMVVNDIFQRKTDFDKFIEKHKFFYSQDEFKESYWTLVKADKKGVKKKIESCAMTLEDYNTKIRLGIATGANYAFIINESTRKELLERDPRNIEIIKPILRGRDIFRYHYEVSGLYILLTMNGINVQKEYPEIYKYLDLFGKEFKTRGAQGKHWTNLRACSFFDDFQLEKIIWIELTDENRFCLCTEEIYLVNSAYFLISPKVFDSKYLLSILNSKLMRFYLSIIAETSGLGTTRWINNYVKQFPIREISFKEQEPFIDIVNRIDSVLNGSDYKTNSHKKTQVKQYELKVDQMVYNLYGLTDDEIAIVEGNA